MGAGAEMVLIPFGIVDGGFSGNAGLSIPACAVLLSNA